MWTALNTEDPNRMRLYLAEHDGGPAGRRHDAHGRRTRLVLLRRLTTIRREVQPSNAIQWRMLRDAYALGATVYDLRGITDSLDETDHLFGLIQFKVGTGGQAAEYIGEWDFPLNKLLHKALDIYMSRR